MGQEKVRKIVAENFSELKMEGEGRGQSRILKNKHKSGISHWYFKTIKQSNELKNSLRGKTPT